MQYEDRAPEDNLNTPDHHPVREFLKLAVMAAVAVVVLGIILNFAGSRLGALLPFKAELWITERVHKAAIETGQQSPFEQKIVQAELQQYLQSVADKVAVALEVDTSMPVTLHYSSENVINAFATLGGHVYFFKGLLDLLPHENALAMLIAHEYSHVTLRHPAKGLGGGLALAIGTSAVGLGSENQLFSLGSRITSSSFSRSMETEADRSALVAVNAIYGHVGGAAALFELFMQQRQGGSSGQFENFVSTHPLDQQRIAQIDRVARDNRWSVSGQLTPLPDGFQQWLRVQ